MRRRNISQWIKNKKGSGEIVVVLLLVVLGLFFLTKYVFKIPFPFIGDKQQVQTVSEEKAELNSEDKNKRITLYFEGIATESVIYLNGCVLHRSFTGYTPFEVDITDFVKFDEENHLAVYVDSNVHEGWWYSGGGIYRNVKLIKTSLISVDLYGVYVKPMKLDNDTWKILTEVTVRNDTLEDMNVLATVNILDSNKNFVTKTEVSGIIMGKNKSVLKAETTLKNPKLWSPENPTLYYAKTALSVDIKVIDEYETHFGFRTFYADANKGFFINFDKSIIYIICGIFIEGCSKTLFVT